MQQNLKEVNEKKRKKKHDKGKFWEGRKMFEAQRKLVN